MQQQSNLPYVEPYDQPFRSLQARCVGRTTLNHLTDWMLDARTSTLTLSNSLGVCYELGRVVSPTKRCSIAFLRHTDAFIVIENLNDEKFIYRVDLTNDTPVLHPLAVELLDYKDITLTYWRSHAKDHLIVTAIGKDGIYRGLMDELGQLELELFNRVEVYNPPLALFRVGVNVANQLQTEIVELKAQSD